MSNKIKFARSTNKTNIPQILDYGEPGYIKNQEFIVGNGDGTGFTVNDYNNLINKPDPLDHTVTIVAGMTIPAFTPIAVNASSQAVIADKSTTALARVYGFTLTAGDLGDTLLVQVSGDIENPAWNLSPGMTYYLGQSGALVTTYSGFVSTDYVSPLGIALTATILAVNIELGFSLGVLSVNGRSGSITLTPSDVGLSNPVRATQGGTGLQTLGDADQLLGITPNGLALEYKTLVAGDGIAIEKAAGTITISATASVTHPTFHNSTALIEETLAYLTVTGALGCRFDIVYHTANTANVRCESILATIGADDTINWNATTTQDIGDTSGIKAILGTTSGDIELGFDVTSGEWFFVVTAYPIALGAVNYVVAGVPTPSTPRQPRFGNTTAQTAELPAYLVVAGAKACRFDIIYYTADMANVRLESLFAAVGANDAITWNAATTQDIGDTSGITPMLGTTNNSIELGFDITSGSWMFEIVAYPVAINTATYTVLSV